MNTKWMKRYAIWVDREFIGEVHFITPLTALTKYRFKKDFAENHGMYDWHNVVLNRKVGK